MTRKISELRAFNIERTAPRLIERMRTAIVHRMLTVQQHFMIRKNCAFQNAQDLCILDMLCLCLLKFHYGHKHTTISQLSPKIDFCDLKKEATRSYTPRTLTQPCSFSLCVSWTCRWINPIKPPWWWADLSITQAHVNAGRLPLSGLRSIQLSFSTSLRYSDKGGGF